MGFDPKTPLATPLPKSDMTRKLAPHHNLNKKPLSNTVSFNNNSHTK